MEDFSALKELQQFNNLEYLAKQVVEGFVTGLHKSPFHGFSVEFAEHRQYNQGDSIKNIDWKLFGRTDKIYTKRYEEETNLKCHIVMDISSSMYYPAQKENKIRFAALTAAALITLLKKQRDAFALTLFDEKISYTSATKSTTTHQKNIFFELEKTLGVAPELAKTALPEVLTTLADTIPKRSLVIILSDFFQNVNNHDSIFAALQQLKYNQNEVLVFHVMDQKTELDLDFNDQQIEFVDLENGSVLKLNTAAIKSNYQQSVAGFLSQLQEKCFQYKIDFIPTNITDGFDKVLTNYLIKRSKMH
ncbi:MAG: hypothetical protein RI934_803 [Bacteroidota bacterium]|jgi:uncharacterized protein (DUF58 family)